MHKHTEPSLLKNTIDSSLDMIQVFDAVRDDSGTIIDFVWVLNNKASEKYYGDVIGQSLLEKQPGVVKEGIFDNFKRVVETGEPNISIHHYVHEQFDGWYQQSAVKQGDGVTTTTRDVSDIMRKNIEIEHSKRLLQDIINAPEIGISVYRAVRNAQGAITRFVVDYANRASKTIMHVDLNDSLLRDSPNTDTADFHAFVEVIEMQIIKKAVTNITLSGEERWFSTTNTYLDADRLVHTWEDVTNRKRVEEEVRIASQQLQATLDSSFYFVQAFEAVRDASGHIVDFTWLFTNNTWNELYGDMIGKSLLEANPAVLETGLFAKFIHVTETGEPVDHEQFYSYEQFDSQWFHQTLVKLGDGFVMNTEDITPRKRAELEVIALRDEIAKKAEDKYFTIFNTIAEGLAVLEMLYDVDAHPKDLRWVETNPAFLRMIDEMGVVGKTCSEVAPMGIHPLSVYQHILETGESHQSEYFEETTSRWYFTHTSRIGDKGSRTVLKIVEDITKRKNFEIALRQSEKKYRVLFESIDEGFALMELVRDPSGKVIDFIYREVNDAFMRFTGWQHAIGQRGTTLLKNLDPSLLDNMQLVLDSKESYRKEDYVVDLDRWFDVYYSCAELPYDNTIVAVFKDATERKRYEFQQQLILRLSDRIRPLNAENAVIEAFCEEVGAYFNVARCGYLEVDAENGEIKVRRDWSTAPLHPLRGTWSLSLLNKQVLSTYQQGGTLQSFKTFNSSESPESPESSKPSKSSELSEKAGVQDIIASLDDSSVNLSTMSVQIMTGEEWSASFYLHDVKPRTWTAEEVKFLEDLSARLWSAVRRTKTEQELINTQAAYRLSLEKEVRERTQELHKSRDQLQSILDTTLVQMSILEAVRDAEGRMVDFEIKATNHELEKETGRDDLIGKWYAREYPGIKAAGLYDLIIKTVETGVSQSKEYFYPHDGFTKWFQCMFVKFGDGVVATNMDITARKSAEEDRLRNYILLQQSEAIAEMGSWDYDLRTQKFSCSDGMYRLFGLDAASPISPEIYTQYTTPSKRVSAEQVVSNIRQGSGDFEETVELEINQVVRVIRIKAIVIYDRQGLPERILGVDLDISAMREAQNRLRQMEVQQQLEIFRVSLSTVEEERHRISESLHNGIAQILYGIKINLGMLMQNMDREDYSNTKIYVDKLLTEVISETRRISHELMPTSLEEFGLESAIDDVCEQFSNHIHITCSVRGFTKRLDKYVELAIYRTTQELMTNVVKHAEATACTIRIEASAQEILILVKDNGKGISENPTRKQGIGLRAIRSKIKLLNGTLRMDSSPGKGTEVEVRIPNQ